MNKSHFLSFSTELTTSDEPLNASLTDQFTDDHPVEDVYPKGRNLDSEDTSSIATSEDEKALQHVQTAAREQTPEDVAERVSADAIIDAVHEIVNKPSDDLPSSPDVITDESIINIEDESEQSATDSPIPHFQQMTPTEFKVQEEPIDSKKDETLQSIKTTSITEIVEDKSKEAEPEEFPLEALSGIVRDILATPVTVHLPYVEQTIETTTEEDKTVTSVPITTTTTTEVEEVVRPEPTRTSLDIDNDQKSDTSGLSTQALTETVRDILATPVTIHLPSVTTTAEESARKSSVDLTIPVSEEITTVKKETELLQSVQTPENEVKNITSEELPDQPSSAQEKAEDEPIALEKITTVTTSVEQTSQLEQQLPDDVKETNEEQIVPTDFLAQTVRDILATPVSVHLPSVEHKTESTISTKGTSEDLSEQLEEKTTRESESDRLSSDSLAEIAHEILSTPLKVTRAEPEESTKTEILSTEAPVEMVQTILGAPLIADLPSVTSTSETTIEDAQFDRKPVIQTDEDWEIVELPSDLTSTGVTGDVLVPKSVTITSTVENVREVDSKDQSISVQDAGKEVEANSLTSESSTKSVHLPSVDSPSDTTANLIEEPVEKLSTGTFPSSDEEATVKREQIEFTEIPSITETVEKPTSEDATKLAAERITSETLTKAIEDILAVPSPDSTTYTTTTELSSSSDEETALKSELLKSIEISSTAETTEDTTSEEARKLAAERITSEVLTQAVEEISAGRPSDHVAATDRTTTSAEQDVEKQTIDTSLSSEEARKAVAERITSETLAKAVEEATSEERDVLSEDARRLAAERVTSEVLTKAVEEISATSASEEEDQSSEDARKVAAERITSEALSKAVEEISTTSATDHTPFIDSTTDTTTISVKQQVEKPSNEFSATPDEEARKQAAERITSDVLTKAVEEITATAETADLPSIDTTADATFTSSEQDIEKPTTKTSLSVEEETATKGEALKSIDISSAAESTEEIKSEEARKQAAERITSEVLTQAVEEISTAPITGYLPSVEQKVEKSQLDEQPSDESVTRTSEQLQTVAPHSTDLPSEVPTETDSLQSIESSAERTTSDTDQETITFTSEALPSQDETKDETSGYKTDDESEISKVSSVVQTTEEATSDDARKIIADRLSSEALVKAVEEIEKPTEENLETASTESLAGSASSSSSETTEPNTAEIVARSEHKTIDEPTDADSTLTTPEVTVKSTAYIQELSSRTSDELSPSSTTKLSSIYLAHDQTSAAAPKTSSDYLMEANEQSSASFVPSVSYEEVTNGQTTFVPTHFIESSEEEPQFHEVISPEDDQTTLQSTAADTNEVAVKSEILSSPLAVTSSIPEPEDESTSLLLYTTANELVTDTIAHAYRSVQDSDLVQNNDQPLSTSLTTDQAPERTHAKTDSTDELSNIVETMLNLSPKTATNASISDEDKQKTVASTTNLVNEVTIPEPTTSIETTIKPPSLQIQVPEQIDTTEESSPKRASAVTPSLTTDDSSHDNSLHTAPIFFVPGTPTPMETDFREIYDHRHFLLASTPEPEFSAVSDEETIPSAPQVEEKKATTDLPLAYFELQEQRHTLMSPQQSTADEKTETKDSPLTTWTTTQPLFDYENIEEKKEVSDVNLDDNAYENARRFDLESPSIISNLPTTEYHQVFGLSDDVINTMDDITQKVAETLSQESEITEQSMTSDNADESSQLQVELSPATATEKEPIPDNVQRITEALIGLESDLIEQSQLSKTDAPEYDNLSTTFESDGRQTLEDRSDVVPAQDELVDEDLLPKESEQTPTETKSKDDLTSNAELDGRYSVLLNRIDSLEKPLLHLQSSVPSNSETQTTITETTVETDDSRPLHERYNVLLDHIHRLTEATNENLVSETTDNERQVVTSTESKVNIDGLARTMEEILAKPVRTIIHPYEKFAHQEQAEMSSLESALEQILATTQFQTNNTILPAPVDTVQSSMVAPSQNKETSKTEPSDQTYTSVVLKEQVSTIEEEEETTEDKPQSTASHTVTTIIPVITVTEELSDPTDSGEFPDEEVQLSSSKTIEETTIAEEKSASPIIGDDDEEGALSTANLVDVLKSISPSALRTTDPNETTYEDIVLPAQNEKEQVQEISSPVAGYFTSNDVYHAYKQPIEPAVEVKDTSSIITTSKDQEEDVDQATKSSGSGLMEIMKNLLPSALRSSKTDVLTSEQDLPQDTQLTVEKKEQESVTSPVSNDFSSSDVSHADRQPVIPIIEEEKTADTDDQATTSVNDITSSGTSVLPRLRPSEDRVSLSDRSSYSEEDASSQETAIYVGTRSTPELSAFDEEIPYTTGTEDRRLLSKSLQSVEKIEQYDEQEPRLSSSGGLLEIMKSFLPSNLRSTKQEQEVSQTHESTVETDRQQLLSRPALDDSGSTSVYEVQEQPVEASAEEKESSGIIDRAKSLVNNIISSATSVLPTSTSSEEPMTISDTELSTEQRIEPVSQVEMEKTIVSTTEQPETTVTESTQQPSSTGLLEIMKSFVPSAIRSKTSSITESEEPTPTATEEKETLVSSALETTDKSEVSEEHPIESIQSQETVDTSAEAISDEKQSTGILSRLTSVVSSAISAVQHALPTSTSFNADLQEQESLSESAVSRCSLSQVEMVSCFLLQLQTSLLEEQKDQVVRTEESMTETTTSLDVSKETPTESERPTTLLKDSAEGQPEVSNIDEEKDILIETSKEILAAPLQSAVDKYEEIVSTQQEPSSPKATTSDHPSSEVVDSEIELLSATQPPVTDDSEQQETITTTSTSIAEEKPSQPLQVVNDDYPWYSSYYTIADADAKVAALYQRLSNTIKQLDQRPSSTTVEFQPEPLEKISSSDYDRQALTDTKDTREKVHELAQLSTKITSTTSKTTTTSSPEEPENDDSGFQLVQRRKRVPSSTVYEKTSSVTTPQSPLSPDIDLIPLVLHRQSSVPSTAPSTISQTTTTTTTSTSSKKKKDKKKKNNKKEMILYDASVPTASDTDEPKAETIESAAVEVHSEATASDTDEPKAETIESGAVVEHLAATASDTDKPKAETIESVAVEEHPAVTAFDTDEPKVETIESVAVEEHSAVTASELPSAVSTDDLLPVDQKLEDVKDESKQKFVETVSETQFTEPLSTSNISDGEELKDVDDEKNDSTSSDASQWLSSSFVTISEDTKTDTKVTEESVIADTSPRVHEAIQVETKPVSTPTKKKKSKSKSVKQESKQQQQQQPERPPSPPEVEEPEVQPTPTPVTVTKTTTTTIRSTRVTSPEQPDEEDNEGFQVVSYRKHLPSGSGSEKISPPSSTSTSAQRLRSDSERQAAVTQQRQDATKSTSAPSTKTKKKSKKEETGGAAAAALSSTSTDTDFVSSSSIDSSQAKINKTRTADQDKKRTEAKQSKSLQSSSETFSTDPSQTSEEKAKQQQQQTILQSQLTSSSLPSLPTVSESDLHSMSSLPPLPPTKTASATTLRVKAFTSPEEEEEEDDNEGFQVVHHRKRISSAPRSDKSLPPIPPRSPYKQNYGRDNNRRPAAVHGRHGSETRSMPRTTTGGQTVHQRQQNRPNQNVRPAAPFNTLQPYTPPKTRISSLSDVESRRSDQNQAPFSDQRPRISSDTMLQTISTEPRSQPVVQQKQQSTEIERQSVLPVAQSSLSNQIEQSSFSMSVPVAKPTEPTIQEYRSTMAEERKPVVQSPPTRTPPSPTITVIATPTTKKSKLAEEEEEDDDGFRVVRYRRHTPSSPTATVPSKQQPSSSSDSDRRRTNIPRKHSSSPSVNLSTATASPLTVPKKKPAKPKKSKDEATGSRLSSSANTLSTSNDADFVSSSMEEFKIESTSQYPRASSPAPPSSSTKEVTKTTVTSEPITTVVQEPVQSSTPLQIVQKPLNETESDVQPTVPTTSSLVVNADTSEESEKRTKKKHKRLKREPAGSEVSTPSEDISSTSEPLFTTKPTSSISPLPAPTQTETTSVIISTSEEVPSSPSVEPSASVEDEHDAPSSSKKAVKRRKKKAQTTDEESDFTSSTTSTTDKDSSSAAAASTSAKQVSLESSSGSRLVSDADKQESEWTIPYSKTKESTVIEPTLISPSNEQTIISSQSTTPKIVPEKVTDVQFKFQKSGELTVTGPTSLERSPTQWGTVKFLPEEQDLPQAPVAEEELASQPTTDAPVTASNQIKPETPTKSNESSEAGGENDLGAYRDSTGRLRRKKPRKTSNTASKPDEILSPAEQQPSEEKKIDQKSISEQRSDVPASPLSKPDEKPVPSGLYQVKRSFEYENTSDTSSKLDSFLPDYIREQIKATSTPRALSAEPTTPVSQVPSTQALPPSSSNRSTSTDTSENESRKQAPGFVDEEFYVADSSSLPSTTDQTEGDTLQASSSSLSTSSVRKKKQRPKMLKKDLEAKTLLTHEFDEAPSTTTETQQTAPVTQTTEEENKDDESFLSSIRHQLSSAISNLSESFTSAISSKSTTNEPTTVLPSDEPVPSIEESPTPSPITSSEVITTTTIRKSSARSARKRSKRDSGPDYESIVLQSTGDNEQSFADKKATSTQVASDDDNQPDLPRNETHKQHSRQRTTSGRLVSNTEEENEQQAILADDEEDEDVIPKPTSFHSVRRSSRDSSLEGQDASPSNTLQQKQWTETSTTEEVQSTTQVTDESQLDNEATTNEQLRSVQGFHTFTPNKYQYNQYEEGSTTSVEPAKPLSIESESGDAVVARGLSLWLQREKGTESDSSIKKKEKPTGESGLTRAMQSLIIQPVESEDDAEEEEDSWNGPRAKKPTYTTGILIEKRIHSTSGYNINHPRATTATPSWLISQSIDKPSPDNSSKYEPEEDEEENSLDDVSDKQPVPSSTLNSQFSTKEERQAHLTNLVDLTFQPTTSILSSSSSSLSSTAKWNDTSVRSDDNPQQQTSFTEDDVQRCLGENFYRESLAVDILPTEQRTITSLAELVMKPSQSLDDADDDDDLDIEQTNRNKNNNNNNQRPINFDEWAHFLEQKYNQDVSISAGKTSSPIEQQLSTSPPCSYARVIDDDTLISDPNRSRIIEISQQSHENDKPRYGDFSSFNDDTDDDNDESSPISESKIQSTSQVPQQHRPSETFQRWRNQPTRASIEHSLSNQNSLENQNDDEILISHTDGGLSRRVRPSS